MTPNIVLVAAMARHRAIGMGGAMPWHLPADLEHFKAVTLGHPVIMGRKTFESIGRPLPGRDNVVISRGQPDLPAGVRLVGSLDEALEYCAQARQAMVIGGGEIYAQALPRAAIMELTFIDTEVQADTRFPRWSPEQWRLESMSVHPPDEVNTHRLVFCRFRRHRAD